MKALKGLVSGVVDGKLVVELENGITAKFQKRDGIKYGDKVWVGYNFEEMKVGHILPDPIPCGVRHAPTPKPEPVEEDYSLRLNSDEAMGSLPQDDEDFEDFEAMGSLPQDDEDYGSSSGE